MKELSIEEKAKAYDEAIEKAKYYYDEGKTLEYANDIVSEIFPELKESEDEKISKEIRDFICWATDRGSITKEQMGKSNLWLAWLEKQCEKESVTCPICGWEFEKQGEQKPAAKYKVGDTIYYDSFGRLVSFVIANIVEDGTDNPMYEDKDGNSVFQNDIIEQKNAWSEEDERIYQSIMDDAVQDNQLDDKQIDWLRDIKYRYFPQPKQEWSEKDECLRRRCIGAIEMANLSDYTKDNLLNWLKSLRPQNTWKPSDLPHWKKSTLPNDNTTGFNSDYFCYKGYVINYKELFEKLPKDD